MVAYSFKKQFVEPIRKGTKRQTIRAVGKRRHARVGEKVQLYCGMRTAHCFKILERDPTCVYVDEISFDLTNPRAPVLKRNGELLEGGELHRYARRDGFKDFAAMVAFWLEEHGPNRFKGYAIVWSDG